MFPLQAIAMSVDGRGTTRAHGTPDMPVWGEVFGRTTGTGTSRVDSAVARITHSIWSIQKVTSDATDQQAAGEGQVVTAKSSPP